MADISTDLKGVQHLSDTTLMIELESNLKMFLDWGLLRIRGWIDVASPTTTIHGGNLALLRLVSDPSYTDGQVWESARKDWVWETDVNYIGKDFVTYNPTVVDDTVNVDGSPTAYDWIDYPLGRVYFDTPIDTSATVLAEYAYKWVQVYRATDSEWWHELQFNSFNVEDAHFTQLEAGTWSIGSQHRIQMPMIMIEAVPRSNSRGYELGNGNYWVVQDVVCYVLAENSSDRNKLLDILRGQHDKNIWLFNSNQVSEAEAWGLDERGMLIDGTATYPNFVDADLGYRWTQCRFIGTATHDVDNANSRLYVGAVRLSCECVLSG